MNMDHNSIEVLLVEDNLDDAELTTRELIKNHFANSLFHVKDGAEALDFIFARGQFSDRSIENCPRVILLDLKMPKVNGLEVLAKLKADPATRAVPVVIMTSSDHESDMSRSYELSANSYIVKPVDFAKFTEHVSRLGQYWLAINRSPTSI